MRDAQALSGRRIEMAQPVLQRPVHRHAGDVPARRPGGIGEGVLDQRAQEQRLAIAEDRALRAAQIEEGAVAPDRRAEAAAGGARRLQRPAKHLGVHWLAACQCVVIASIFGRSRSAGGAAGVPICMKPATRSPGANPSQRIAASS
jgi:hypothetical protein